MQRASKKSFAGRLALGLLTLALGAAGCNSTSTIAGDMLRRTIPAGDMVPTLSGPVWTRQSAGFTWEFETHLTGNAYTDWLVGHLRDFRILERDGSHVQLAKTVEGDTYALTMALDPDTARTYVRFTFSASPD